jgi:hypothetical protein
MWLYLVKITNLDDNDVELLPLIRTSLFCIY